MNITVPTIALMPLNSASTLYLTHSLRVWLWFIQFYHEYSNESPTRLVLKPLATMTVSPAPLPIDLLDFSWAYRFLCSCIAWAMIATSTATAVAATSTRMP